MFNEFLYISYEFLVNYLQTFLNMNYEKLCEHHTKLLNLVSSTKNCKIKFQLNFVKDNNNNNVTKLICNLQIFSICNCLSFSSLSSLFQAWQWPTRVKHLALPTSIRLGRKELPGTNTLA